MNKVLTWVKSNLAIVICGAIIVIAPVVAYVVSSGMNAGVRKELEERVSGSWNELTRGGTTTYTIPAALPGGEPVNESGPLNASSLNLYAERLSRLKESSDRLYQTLLEANAANRAPIIEGIFPEPAPTEAQVKPIDFADEYPKAHAKLLQIINAGSPPAGDLVQDALNDVQSTYLTSLGRTEEAAALSEDERAELAQRLRQRRLELYFDQSQRLSVYATPDAFQFEVATGVTGKPTLAECYQWQEAYWLRQDILEALASANREATGKLQPVTQAPVKRLISLVVDPPVVARQARPLPDDEPTPPQPIDPATAVELDYSRSLTGRAVDNGLYDVRTARVTVHVESNRLPQVLKAISTSDLLAVTNVSLAPVDQWTLLKDGYMYGQSHVVEATIDVEGLLLREWAAEYMPPAVKEKRGVPEPQPEGAIEEG